MGKQQIRVVFRSSPDAEIVSLWVDTDDPGGDELALTLTQDYDDFSPEVGGHVEWGGRSYEIYRVEGRNVHAARVGG